MSYLTTPYVVYSGFQTVGTLRNMLIAALGTAQARGRRIVALGDSRATPTGQGADGVCMLNYEWWKQYANCPETNIVAPHAFGNGAAPGTGLWLLAGHSFNGSSSPQTTANQLYDMEGALACARRPATDLGPLLQVQHDAYSCTADPAYIPRSNEYFTRVGMRFEILVPDLNGASPAPNFTSLQWVSYQSASSTPGYFDTQTATGTIDTTASVAAEGPVRSYLTPAFTWNTAPSGANLNSLYGEVVIGSNSAVQKSDMAMLLARSANTRGIAYSTFGKAGTTSGDLLGGTGAAGADPRATSYRALNAIGPNAVVLRWGVNDAAAAMAVATYRANMQANVNWIRANVTSETGDAPLVILVADPDRDLTGNAPGRVVFDLYADALAAIAAATPGVVFINLRRILEEKYGWKQGVNLGTYLLDDVHYNTLGWSKVAAEEVLALSSLQVTDISSRANRSRSDRMIRP